jgi:hypothetical protein
VFNLGHGISQFTPPESVTAMVEAVHSFSRRQRAGLKRRGKITLIHKSFERRSHPVEMYSAGKFRK